MDNYFILSSKVGDKWTKVASNMTSIKLGTSIHIVGELSSFGDFGGDTLQATRPSFTQGLPRRVHSDSPTLSYPVNDSMTIFTHAFCYPWDNHFIIPEHVTISLFGWCTWLVWSGIEEVGCQAREKFSEWENCWGLIYVGAKLQLQCSEISGLTCFWSPRREVGQLRDCWVEKGKTSLGGKGMWGMRGCRLLVEWAPETESFLLSLSLNLDRSPLP